MRSSDNVVLCRYHYDPLDRLASAALPGQEDVRPFYQKNHLTTEIRGALQCTLFQHDDQLLGQQQRLNGVVKMMLLVTDQKRSIVHALQGVEHQTLAYTAYGHCPVESGLISLLGFNGERRDSVTGNYLLGNGYRAFNPVLMRFNSPDSLSPFGEGGLNGYAYCQGDPINSEDPTGHARYWMVTSPFVRRVALRTGRIGAPPPISKLASLVGRRQTVIDKINSMKKIGNQFNEDNLDNLGRLARQGHLSRPDYLEDLSILKKSLKDLTVAVQKSDLKNASRKVAALSQKTDIEDGSRRLAATVGIPDNTLSVLEANAAVKAVRASSSSRKKI